MSNPDVKPQTYRELAAQREAQLAQPIDVPDNGPALVVANGHPTKASVNGDAVDLSVAPPLMAENGNGQDKSALTIPDECYLGLARDFANLYSDYLETPRSFLYHTFLTHFGARISEWVTLDSEVRPQPRLYTIVLGESADDRKSTALDVTEEFFAGCRSPIATRTLRGAGSAEGLARVFMGTNEGEAGIDSIVLHYDEFKTFVDKSSIDGSVLLPMVGTLWAQNAYESHTAKHHLKVENAKLSLVAACTRETYSSMFSHQYHDIGFLNRLWLVVDTAEPRFSLPPTIPTDAKRDLQRRVGDRLHKIYETYTRYPSDRAGAVPYAIAAGARRMFDEWYFTLCRSVFTKRLDSYGHRRMILLAAVDGRAEVHEEIMAAVLGLLRYQLAARLACDPVKADTKAAQIEERIRRVLAANGPLTESQLKYRCHYTRYGLWLWRQALNNLVVAREIELKEGRYRLVQGMSQ